MLPYVILLFSVVLFTSGLPSPQGCQHDGKLHKEGSEVTMADPCVRCKCVRGVLVCRLRVCPPQPLPPPPGCLLLTRHAECCQRLVCHPVSEPPETNRRRLADDFLDVRSSPSGCVVNGSVYAEGSAMDSSTRCQYCYCIQGQSHCVKPQCLLAHTDCIPVYTPDSCCPTKYNCSGVRNDSTTTTVKPISGCQVDGRLYPEGEMVPHKGGECEHCYCLRTRLHCEPVVCSVPVNKHCQPVLTPGHCCPTSYNCSSDWPPTAEDIQSLDDETEEDMIASNTQAIGINHLYVNSERSITGIMKNSETNDLGIQTTQPTSSTFSEEESTTLLVTTITTGSGELTTLEEETMETSTYSSPTTDDTTILPSTTAVTDFTDTEERVNAREEDLTTTNGSEELTTLTVLVTNDSLVRTVENALTENILITSSSPTKSLPSEIEAILNQTKSAEKDEDYDYDYNEPSLPPSLPNLRIIPFVAADAVVDDAPEPGFGASRDKSHPNDAGEAHFYPHGFSPPAETEGGFVPKESPLDGPFYESKYDDNNFHTTGHKTEGVVVDSPSATLSTLPAITQPPTSPEEERCLNGGQSYGHGELLTEPSACDLCMCYYGKILCQEPKCPVPDPGCRLLRDRELGSCCRKIVCSGNSVESPTRVVESLTPAPHLPPFTVADVIVTPDPFRDVIRTEPAPDLSSLVGEILPFLWDQSTTTPVSLTTAESVETPGSAESVDALEAANKTSTANSVIDYLSTSTLRTESLQETSSVIPENYQSTIPEEVSSSFTKYISTSTQSSQSLSDLLTFKNETKTKPTVDYDYQEVKEEEPVDDEFSLGSVFSYFFDSEKWTTTEKSILQSKKPLKPEKTNKTELQVTKMKNKTDEVNLNQNKLSVEHSLEHRSDENVNEVRNSLNSTSETGRPQNLQKTTNIEYLSDNKVLLEIETTTQIPAKQKTTEKIIQSTTLGSKMSTKLYGSKYTSTYTRPFFTKPTPATHLPSLSVPDPGAASGLLKLAGCNIYGRMYRVGRIISELSGPCLECMCTEVGVQCRPLSC